VRIKTFICPAYPNQSNLVSYVVNGWYFSSPADQTGVEWDGQRNPYVPAVSKLTGIQQPADTIYLADDEYDQTRVFLRTNDFSAEQYDVWSPNHLPYNAYGTENPQGIRRVSKARHRKGPNLLYFDGHSALKDARKIIVDDWRDRKS